MEIGYLAMWIHVNYQVSIYSDPILFQSTTHSLHQQGL